MFYRPFGLGEGEELAAVLEGYGGVVAALPYNHVGLLLYDKANGGVLGGVAFFAGGDRHQAEAFAQAQWHFAGAPVQVSGALCQQCLAIDVQVVADFFQRCCNGSVEITVRAVGVMEPGNVSARVVIQGQNGNQVRPAMHDWVNGTHKNPSIVINI